MINVNELRIGNIVTGVYDESMNPKREEIIVEAITSLGVNLEYGDTMYKEETLDGIPLTEEWLLRLAFTFGNRRWRLQSCDDKILYNLSTRKLQVSGYKYIPVESVHTLQNIFYCLTGKELILKP